MWASQRDHAIWPHNEGMLECVIQPTYSWVARQRGMAGSTFCLLSCLTFSTVLFPPFSLLYFVREINIYRANILAMRVRDDIHTQRYTHTLSVLRGNILSVSTELCLSHTMVTTSSHQCISQSPSLSFSHYSQSSLYPNIGLFLPITAPCREGMLCRSIFL